jgi:hypothetical protein
MASIYAVDKRLDYLYKDALRVACNIFVVAFYSSCFHDIVATIKF